jgi:hypothetical protein
VNPASPGDRSILIPTSSDQDRGRYTSCTSGLMSLAPASFGVRAAVGKALPFAARLSG